MALNDTYRQWVSRIVAAGVNQTAVAAWIGVDGSWISHWLSGTGRRKGQKPPVINAHQMDRLKVGAGKLADLLTSSIETATPDPPIPKPSPPLEAPAARAMKRARSR